MSRLTILTGSEAPWTLIALLGKAISVDRPSRPARWLVTAVLPIAHNGVSEALYLRDPDGNGVELYRDRPPKEWPRTAEGGLAMNTRRLDLDDLLRESDSDPA